MTLPTVSVVVAVFNGERFVGEALASLRHEQNVAEIIVTDDGSTDGSAGVVKALAAQDSRIRLMTGAHRGVSATRNILLSSIAMTYVRRGGSHVRRSSSRPILALQSSSVTLFGSKR
jgi:glycosyltransferase involved in cell wall biosynthesis